MKVLIATRRFIFAILAAIGSLVVGLFLYLYFAEFRPKHVEIKLDSVLNLHLGESYLLEYEKPRLFMGEFAPVSTFSLGDIIKGIHHAKSDERIKGILLEIEGPYTGMAKAQEIHEALEDFKTSGKFVIAFGKTFGEMSNGTVPYYLATIADKIWIQPQGTLGLTGFIIEVPFAHQLLDAIGVKAQIGKRKAYKSLMDSLTEPGFTTEHKESMQTIAANLYHQVSQGIAKGRNILTEDVEDLINEGPFLGSEAVDEELIDEEGYIGDVKDEIEQKLKTKPTYIKLKDYLHAINSHESGPEIAIVYIEGKIVQREDSESGGFGEVEASDGEIAEALRQVAEDKNVKAIVLRVNSGGGSAVASETIWNEVKKASLVKPVIGSMSDMAASGGYLVVTPCQYIFAQDGTLTGSIGVVGGKIVTEDLWKKIGINWENVHEGENASIDSTFDSFTPIGWGKLNTWLDEIYDSFKKKVADGRKISLEDVENIAQGRVWTGQEALKNKLVDAIGGLDKAIDYAKKQAGIKADETVKIVEYPKIKSLSDQVVELLTEGKIKTQLRPLTQVLVFIESFIHPLAQGNLEIQSFKVK